MKKLIIIDSNHRIHWKIDSMTYENVLLHIMKLEINHLKYYTLLKIQLNDDIHIHFEEKLEKGRRRSETEFKTH